MSANIWTAAADGRNEIVQQLIESGKYSPNSPDPNGYTPMHAAAAWGNIPLLRYLVSKGGDVNVQDDDGDTPLHHTDTLDVAQVLVTEFNADFKIKDNDGMTAAAFAEDNGEDPQFVAYLKGLESLGSSSTSELEDISMPNGEHVKLMMSQTASGEADENDPALKLRREKIQKIMEDSSLTEEQRDNQLRQVLLDTLSKDMDVFGGSGESEPQQNQAKRQK